MSWTYETITDGHFVRVSGRRKMTGVRYFYVQAQVWEGPEPTGEPVADWELPAALRYSPVAAASLAVRQTLWQPGPEDSDRRLEVWDYNDPECDHTPVTFVMQRERLDGRKELLSGRDALGKIMILRKAISNKVNQPVWLKIHSEGPGTPVTAESPTTSMIFTVGRINKIMATPVYEVVEETLPEGVNLYEQDHRE